MRRICGGIAVLVIACLQGDQVCVSFVNGGGEEPPLSVYEAVLSRSGQPYELQMVPVKPEPLWRFSFASDREHLVELVSHIVGGYTSLRECPMQYQEIQDVRAFQEPVVSALPSLEVVAPGILLPAIEELAREGDQVLLSVNGEQYSFFEEKGADSAPAQFVKVHNFSEDDLRHFHNLPINDEERARIHKVIHSIGTMSLYDLLLKKKEMEKLGDSIDHVHPMRFLAFIFADAHLRDCMKEVYDSHFKWGRFMNGLSKKMEKNADSNNVLRHVPGFCEVTGADYDRVTHYVIKRDWEGLVKYLIRG